MGTTASSSHLLLLPQLPPQRSLSRTLSSFPLNSPSSPVPFRRAITSPPPLPSMLHFHNPSLSRSLYPIFPPFPPASSFPSSSFLPRCFSFFCPSVSPPFSAFDRSFRKHALKRILDITNPHRTLTVCGWTSSSYFLLCFVLTAFFTSAKDGPFCLASVFAPCAPECVFLQLPIGRTTRRANIRPFRHRLLISSALLSVIVIQGQGMSPSFVTSGAVSSLVVSFIVLSLALPCDVLAYSCSAGYHGCEVLTWKEIGSIRHLVR